MQYNHSELCIGDWGESVESVESGSLSAMLSSWGGRYFPGDFIDTVASAESGTGPDLHGRNGATRSLLKTAVTGPCIS